LRRLDHYNRYSRFPRTEPVNTQRFEHCIAGRNYVIEVLPMSATRWRAQIARLPGMPTSLMPFYGATAEDAARELTNWLSLVSVVPALAIPVPRPGH
jgi:hypothetical protein